MRHATWWTEVARETEEFDAKMRRWLTALSFVFVIVIAASAGAAAYLRVQVRALRSDYTHLTIEMQGLLSDYPPVTERVQPLLCDHIPQVPACFAAEEFVHSARPPIPVNVDETHGLVSTLRNVGNKD